MNGLKYFKTEFFNLQRKFKSSKSIKMSWGCFYFVSRHFSQVITKNATSHHNVDLIFVNIDIYRENIQLTARRRPAYRRNWLCMWYFVWSKPASAAVEFKNYRPWESVQDSETHINLTSIPKLMRVEPKANLYQSWLHLFSRTQWSMLIYVTINDEVLAKRVYISHIWADAAKYECYHHSDTLISQETGAQQKMCLSFNLPRIGIALENKFFVTWCSHRNGLFAVFL